MNDIPRWQRWARTLIAGAVAMTLLWPCVALYRGTNAHDWYAAAKLTVAESMIAAGFSPDGATPYRVADGTVYQATRRGVVEYEEAIEARERIVYTALVGAFHGGLASALSIVLCVMLWRVVCGWRNRGAGWQWRPRDRGPPQTIETRESSGIAEGLPARVTGDARIALWVLSASQAARLMEALDGVKNRRAILAQQSPERADTPLLPAADPADTKAESARAKAKATGAVAKKGRAKAGGGSKPRASSEPPAPDSEDGQSEPDDGSDVNWL